MYYDEIKRIPLYKVAIERLGYKPVKGKDSRLWRCLESPQGHKIITRTVPNENGHFLFSCQSGVKGTIVDLLMQLHDFSFKEIRHFFDLQLQRQYPINRGVDNKSPSKKEWLKESQVINLIRAVRPSYPNLLEAKGLQRETIKRFKVRASRHVAIFPLYRVDNSQLLACSAIEYKQGGQKYFKGPRAISLLSPLVRKDLKNPTVYFFESPLDALAYAQVEGAPHSLLVSFCGLPTSGFYSSMGEFLRYFGARSYTICFDNDEAGRKGVNKLLRFLPSSDTRVVFPPGGKDCMDWCVLRK